MKPKKQRLEPGIVLERDERGPTRIIRAFLPKKVYPTEEMIKLIKGGKRQFYLCSSFDRYLVEQLRFGKRGDALKSYFYAPFAGPVERKYFEKPVIA